jgi:hypothetical protein
MIAGACLTACVAGRTSQSVDGRPARSNEAQNLCLDLGITQKAAAEQMEVGATTVPNLLKEGQSTTTAFSNGPTTRHLRCRPGACWAQRETLALRLQLTIVCQL